MSQEPRRFPSAGAAAEACARQVIVLLEESLAGSNPATFAVSGGSTPKLMFAHLVAAKFDWARVHLFFVDERLVPPGDPQSNYRLAEEHFLAHVKFPKNNIHRMAGELEPGKAAKLYAAEIREFFAVEEGDLPRFDVLQLGTGADVHCASLFPGDPLIEDREGFVAAVHNDRVSPPGRITLLPGVLLAARNTLFLASGEEKADAVYKVFHAPDDPLKYPAQLITRQARRVLWFIDEAAARLLPKP